MAIDCYEKARETWMTLLRQRDSAAKTLKRPEQELFFHLSIGSVHESAGKDDLALVAYMKAKEVAGTLASNHPDRAFPFCGLGSVLYHMEEPAYALRLYLKAREHREATIGGDTVDTATVYNNLGCCMFMLERN